MSGTTIGSPLKTANHPDEGHDEYGLLMSLALDNMLEGHEEEELNVHLSTCAACNRQWQIWQNINRQFQMAPIALPPVNFVQRVEAQLARGQKQPDLRIGLLLAVLTLIIWGIGLAGVGIVLGFLIYNQIGAFAETLHWLAYAWTTLTIVGGSIGRMVISLSENPSALGALVCYVALAIVSLLAWSRLLQRSTRPWQTQDEMMAG
ncbi:MAG: zf-HC2 domain-containing protein [Caldilineaceae bacterium]|nr:zf-HC2 domain-containing protein [Caldilineaceae bacterium]